MTQTTEKTQSHTMTEDAFAALVKQHVDLVYSAAYRQLRDPAQAQDATQAVFILLHRKSPQVGDSIAGWLLKATWYVCRDAKRVAARRRYHERQAMADAPAATTAPEANVMWETYAPYLDDALARLKPLDRDAVILRFFQNKTNRQVGDALALTEDAARKRIDRALARLHEILSAKAAVPAALALGVVLAANAVQAAPAGVATAVLSGGGAATGTSVAVLVKSAAKAMAWAKLKVVAVIVGVCAATVTITTTVVMSQMPAPPAVPVAPAPAPEPVVAGPPNVDPDPADLAAPGRVQIARWDVVLSPRVGAMVRQQGRPVETASVGYDGLLINAAALRRIVASNGALGYAQNIDYSRQAAGWPPDKNKISMAMAGIDYLIFDYGYNRGQVEIIGNADGRSKSELSRLGGNRMQVKAQYRDISLIIREPNRRLTSDRDPHTIDFDITLQAGQAVAFVGGLVTQDGNDYDHMIVWEAYKAADSLQTFIRTQRGAEYWCTQGPAVVRQQAMNAVMWKQKQPSQAVQNPKFTAKLSDGKEVAVIALGRPDLWPNCWWDVDGNPTYVPYVGSMQGKAPAKLQVLLQVKAPDTERELSNPRKSEGDMKPYAYNLATATDLNLNETKLTVGVPVGSWRDLTWLKLDQPVTVDGTRYHIYKPEAAQKDFFCLHFDCDGSQDDLELLLPIGPGGKIARCPNDPQPLVFSRPGRGQVKRFLNFSGLLVEQVQAYKVIQRKREFVTFENFALMPKQQPNTQATQDEFIETELVDTRSFGQTRYRKLRHTSLLDSFHPAQNQQQGELSICKLVLDAANAGDEAAILKQFVTGSPEREAQAAIVARYMMACAKFFSAAQQKAGVQDVYENCEGIRHTDLFVMLMKTPIDILRPEVHMRDNLFAMTQEKVESNPWRFNAAEMRQVDLDDMQRATPVLNELAVQINAGKMTLQQVAKKLMELDEQ